VCLEKGDKKEKNQVAKGQKLKQQKGGVKSIQIAQATQGGKSGIRRSCRSDTKKHGPTWGGPKGGD